MGQGDSKGRKDEAATEGFTEDDDWKVSRGNNTLSLTSSPKDDAPHIQAKLQAGATGEQDLRTLRRASGNDLKK